MGISLEELSIELQAMHVAATSPARWAEAHAAVTRWIGALEDQYSTKEMSNAEQAQHESESALNRVMTLLTAYIEIARQLQKKLAESRVGQLAVAGLDQWAAAAFILDGEGTVHHRNASSRAVSPDISLVNSKLRFCKSSFNRVFEAALREAVKEPPRTSVLPFPSAMNGICEVTVSPLQNTSGPPGDSLRLALVVVARPQPDAEVIVRRVRQLYGLTQAEARVAAALSLGETVEGIAAAHHVQPSTVRAQVRNIFEKTGVNRQSDLVRLALTGAPLFAQP